MTDDVEAALERLRGICQTNPLGDGYYEWEIDELRALESHIAAQAQEIERLRKFAREVLYDHLEIDKQSQCPWCLWVPGRSWEPIHECSAIEMVQVVGTRAAEEAKP